MKEVTEGPEGVWEIRKTLGTEEEQWRLEVAWSISGSKRRVLECREKWSSVM